MRRQTRTLYKFSELKNEKARDRAISDWRAEGIEYFWADEARQSLDTFEEIFPIKITDWSYDSTMGFVRFEWKGEDAVRELSGWRLARYIWNNYRGQLWKGKYYSTPGYYDEQKKYHYKFRHSRIELETGCVLTGYCADDDLLKPIYKFLEKPTDQTFEGLLQECVDSWVKSVVADCEFQESDEAIAEHLTSNDYEFTKTGERV